MCHNRPFFGGWSNRQGPFRASCTEWGLLDTLPTSAPLSPEAIWGAAMDVGGWGFEPLTSAMRSRRRPGVAAPGRCSRQPRARSAFRDPFRHLGLRRIAGRSWKFFVLRAIGRLDDRTAHSADPVADDSDPADFRIGRRASGSRRRGAAGQLDRPRGVFLRRIGLFANNATSCSSGEQPTRLSRASG